MAERRIADIGPLLEDLKKELEDLEGSTEALTVEEATEDEIGELEALPVIDPASLRPTAKWIIARRMADGAECKCGNCGRRDKLTDLWEARETAQRKGKKDGKYHDLVTDMLARAIHSVGIEYADEIAAYEEERRMRRSYYEKVENRANGLQEEEPEEEPDPLSPARAAIATAMQAAKVSEVTGAPLPKPLTWKRGFYDTTRTFPSGWYECPVCGCRVD